jgi:hypothetical protein
MCRMSRASLKRMSVMSVECNDAGCLVSAQGGEIVWFREASDLLHPRLTTTYDIGAASPATTTALSRLLTTHVFQTSHTSFIHRIHRHVSTAITAQSYLRFSALEESKSPAHTYSLRGSKSTHRAPLPSLLEKLYTTHHDARPSQTSAGEQQDGVAQGQVKRGFGRLLESELRSKLAGAVTRCQSHPWPRHLR